MDVEVEVYRTMEAEGVDSVESVCVVVNINEFVMTWDRLVCRCEKVQ